MKFTKQIFAVLFLTLFLIFPGFVSAHGSEDDHSHIDPQAHTVIMNQVRGTSCCDVGSATFFEDQVSEISDLKLPATFTLRYDTLSDEEFLKVIEESPKDFISFGGFLEIIPSLAEDADVEYRADADTWYEAQYAFLIGYSQEDRKKLIDTYMEKYFEVFGYYPRVTTAWMIDAWSLQYLKQEYGVLVHQITREQYGTDSYALYGGPAHYPYWPSENWAMIPEIEPSETMPLIVRQTITDPVENYGDDTSFHTSQPNDYMQDSEQDFEYFTHLFEQAHRQPQLASTFALLGLENSMAEEFQDEYRKQLKYIAEWQEYQPDRQVVPALYFEAWYKTQSITPVHVYAGHKFNDEDQQAWWMTTPFYRARVRRDGNKLYITDLRIYDSSFTDPYLEKKAENLGWWIVPFSLDGSRFFYDQEDPEPNQLALDGFSDRKEQDGEPTHILISDQADQIEYQINDISTEIYFTENGEIKAAFTPEAFFVHNNATYQLNHPWLDDIFDELLWFSKEGSRLFGFGKTPGDIDNYTSFVNQEIDFIEQEREDRYPLLFPELAARSLDFKKSYLYTNNQYAIVGRNPVRLVLFPRDEFDMPILLEEEPEVATEREISEITIKRQHGNSGMIFIDFESDQPLTTTAQIKFGDFSAEQKIFFAPNCKEQVVQCLTHPRQAWWYIQAILDDRQRAKEENQS